MRPLKFICLLALLSITVMASAAVASGYYRIVSYNSKYMTENVGSHMLVCSDLTADDYSQVWELSVANGKTTIKNVLSERYVLTAPGNSWSVQYQTGSSSYSFTLNEEDGGVVTFTDKWGGGPHCDASLNVVIWTNDEAKSKWTIEAVSVDADELNAQRQAYSNYADLQNNASAYTSKLTTYFTDKTCTALRTTYAGYTDEQLASAMRSAGLPQTIIDMAIKVKNNAWATYGSWGKTERTFRVASYKAYSDFSRWSGIIGTGYVMSRLTNPTGISAAAGDVITAYVGAVPNGQSIKLEAVQEHSATGVQYTLAEGFNAVLIDNDCDLFIYYNVDNTTDGKAPYTPINSYAPVTVHIEGGSVNGYFDLTLGDDNSDWANLQTHLLQGSTTVELKTSNLLFHMNTDLVKAACPTNMVELLGEWDKILDMEHSLIGLEDFNGYWNNLLSATSISTDYMYASNYGTYYENSTLASVMSYDDLFAGGALWGPAHENGHVFQKYINMVGQTEVSNNLFSNVAIYNNGHLTSRAALISTTFANMANNVYWNEREIWERTHLYWQLYQFFHILGNDPDFYPQLFKALRADPMTHTAKTFIPASDDYLKFYKKCCQVSGYDLTEFFQAYGFFVIPALTSYTLNDVTKDAFLVGDYSNYYLTVTQSEIDDVKQEVASMNLPKCNIIFIEDRITAPAATYEGAAAGETKNSFSSEYPIGVAGEMGQYTDFGVTPSDYTFNVNSTGTVTAVGSGAVGFKVYDSNGNLVGLYNTTTFTLPDGLTNYTIKAAAGNGTDAVVAYDESIEVKNFPKADVWYAINAQRAAGRYVESKGAGQGIVGTAATTIGNSMQWRFVQRDGATTFDIVNRNDGSYIDPTATYNTQLSTTNSQPESGWRVTAVGNYYIITSATVQFNQTESSHGYALFNWGGGNNIADKGCLFTITEVEAADEPTPTQFAPKASEIYTINNTNSNRGALTYEPAKSTLYVWSSGKSGATAFDASNVNHQWVIIPTDTDGQYYLYNVGAGKFAIPTDVAQSNQLHWVFSDNAVALVFETQDDGTMKIRMATNPVSGTNAAYIGVSNNYTGPIINWNDAGSNFTITKVSGNQSAAANAAVAKLVKNQTSLATYPQTSGWYVIQIKGKQNAASYAGRYIQNASTLHNNLYPLTFTGAVDVQPAITDPTFFTYIDHTSWDVNTWQMPDGRYLVKNSNNKFPTPSATAGNVRCGYDNGNYFKTDDNWYADPYDSNANYFIGETTSMRTAYTVYPIDLAAAGLEAWKVICDNAPDNAQITCSRSDVSGLTSVYKNGYFFLPAGVTPEAGDFTLDGANGVTINATAKTITFAYDPNLAIVADGVSVAQGWQTAGRDSEVMLLSVNAAPFKAATGVTLTVNLKDGSEANISSLKLYEASSASPEIYSTGTGAPTKTEVATANISGSTATFSIGNLSVGTHYYWIGATVKSDATLGAVIDAAVTGITYTCNENETTLDLTAVGDPADRGAMVFNTRSYPFLPRDNGSRVYRIPAMVVANDGSIVAAVDKRYDSHTDIGKGHVIDIVVRRSTNGGKTWGEPVIVAKGDNSSDATCGYGDPSLYKDNDGKLYLLFAAGNTGYFYGLKRVCLSTSSDNGATWTAPVDLYETSKLTDHASSYGSNTCYGLYDYFVTSGRGLCTSEGYLMALLPAQPLTDSGKTAHTSNSQDYIFYSTDKGATWHISENAIFTGGDEAKVIQMNDGSLLASIRQGNNRGFNTATYSLNNDGTLTFTMGTQWNNSQLNAGGYANNQDIFYYQRETDEGKTDVIFHSMTTGQHANLKLYYSTDKGQNWTEFLNVQTKATRYVTMEKSPAGSLYLLFEDQSLNDAGGYTDYNHYPINFLEITRDQLLQLIPTLDDEYDETKSVKVVYGKAAETTYGSWNGLTWTSNAASGMAGLTMTLSDGAHDKFSNWNEHYNLAYHPAANNTASTLTLTAPEGYIIKSYSLQAAKSSSAAHTYTLTADNGTSITPAIANSASGYTELSVSDVNAASTAISITSTDISRWLALADFTVELVPQTALPGDVNLDGSVTIADVTALVNIILGKASESHGVADINDDGSVTIADVTALVNIILGK